MKKTLVSLLIATVTSAMVVTPAIADIGSGESFYSPSGENGGCRAADHWEEDYGAHILYSWAVPDLANGQSVSVTASKGWWNYWGSYYEPQGGPTWTFTCNEGTISGGSSYGGWGN